MASASVEGSLVIWVGTPEMQGGAVVVLQLHRLVREAGRGEATADVDAP